MKAKFLIVLVFGLSLAAIAQDTAHQPVTRIFSFSPMPRKTDKVNGVVVGITHNRFNDLNKPLAINGLNLEINPLTPLILLFLDPELARDDRVFLVHNGLHISTGGYAGSITQNGLGISVYNIVAASNGVSVAGVYNVTDTLNGLHISGLFLSAKRARGLLIAPINKVEDGKGLQVGLYNKAGAFTGVQIGLFNQTGRTKGLQIGLWNKNTRRSLPFINF